MDQIFVFIHRWFRRGEGWAYHPDMEGRVRDIAHAVAPRVLRGERGRFEIPLEHGMLLGEIVADTDCKNVSAIARGASIAKVALLPANPVVQKNVDRLYRALQTVQTPSAEGPHAKLVIKYRGASAPVPHGRQVESPDSSQPSEHPVQQSLAAGRLTAGLANDAPDDQADADAPKDSHVSAPPDTPPDVSSRRISAVLGVAGVAQLIVLYASFVYGNLLLFLCGIVTLGCLAWICWRLRCCRLPARCCIPILASRWWYRRRSVSARPATETDDERGR